MFLHWSLILLILSAFSVYSTDLYLENHPEPLTSRNKVLGLILSYNLGHIDPIILILNEYVSMCEAGWLPTVVMFTTVEWSNALKRFMRQRSYCYRISSPIEVRFSVHLPNISVALGAEHRKYMQNEINNFDVFVYHEDDIVFKHSHLVAYLSETKKLHTLLPESGLKEHCIGFQRYRTLPSQSNWVETDIFEKDLLEETPQFQPICIEKEPYLVVMGNIHQAMWVLAREHVLILQEKCLFLNQSSASREYMSSFSLFDKKQYHCGLTKLIPGERFQTFNILHYYQQRHISWVPSFTSDENIRAGFHYSTSPRSPMPVPECWEGIVKKYREEQQLNPDGTEIIEPNSN